MSTNGNAAIILVSVLLIATMSLPMNAKIDSQGADSGELTIDSQGVNSEELPERIIPDSRSNPRPARLAHHSSRLPSERRSEVRVDSASHQRPRRRSFSNDPVRDILETQLGARDFLDNELELATDSGLGRGDVDAIRRFVLSIVKSYGADESDVVQWLNHNLRSRGIEVDEDNSTLTGVVSRLHDISFDDTDPRRPTSTSTASDDDFDVWSEEVRKLTEDLLLRSTIAQICTQFGRTDRIDDMTMLVARLLVKLKMTMTVEKPTSHLLQGAVQLGKTLVAVLLSSALGSVPTAIVYLSDNQVGNHTQNVRDFRKIAAMQRLPYPVVVAGDLKEDHKPSNREDYSDGILEEARIAISEGGCVVMPCKKNSANMKPLLDNVLTPLSENDIDFRLVILNDEADASTAMRDPETYNKSMAILNEILELPQAAAVLHITATPSAILSLHGDEATAPSHVTVMPRPSSYVSSKDFFLDPSGHSRHVTPFLLGPDDRIPFEQYKSRVDVRILREYSSRAKRLLRRLVLHHTIGFVMLRRDKRFGPSDKDHCALLQLNRAIDVQQVFNEMLLVERDRVAELFEKARADDSKAMREVRDAYERVASIRTPTSPKGVDLDEAALAEMAEACREIQVLPMNGSIAAEYRKLPRGRDPDNPFNGIIISLKMLERARRVPGLHTTVVMHHPKKPHLDLARQRDRGSGHHAEERDFISYWVSPEQDEDLVKIAAADERTRAALVVRDLAGSDLRYENLSDVLHGPAGGAHTGRVAASSRAEEQSISELTRQRFDRGTTELEPIADIEARLQVLRDHPSIESEKESPHPSKNRSRILETDASGLAEILSDPSLELIKPRHCSSASYTALVEEVVEWATANPDHPIVLVLALNGSGSNIMKKLNPKMKLSKKTAIVRDGVKGVLGSLVSGSNNKEDGAAISDWHTDRPDGLLSPSGRRKPEAPMLVLLKVVQFHKVKWLVPNLNGDEAGVIYYDEPDSEDAEGQARLMIGIDAPAGLGGGTGAVGYKRGQKTGGQPLDFDNLVQEADSTGRIARAIAQSNGSSTAARLPDMAGVDTRD